jgi:hypothetical protein
LGVEAVESAVWVKAGCEELYKLLFKSLEELGFTHIEANHGVFYKKMGEDIIVFAVHVDDCMVTGKSQELIDKFME